MCTFEHTKICSGFLKQCFDRIYFQRQCVFRYPAFVTKHGASPKRQNVYKEARAGGNWREFPVRTPHSNGFQNKNQSQNFHYILQTLHAWEWTNFKPVRNIRNFNKNLHCHNWSVKLPFRLSFSYKKRPFKEQSTQRLFTGHVYSHSIKWHLYVSANRNRRMKDVFHKRTEL